MHDNRSAIGIHEHVGTMKRPAHGGELHVRGAVGARGDVHHVAEVLTLRILRAVHFRCRIPVPEASMTVAIAPPVVPIAGIARVAAVESIAGVVSFFPQPITAMAQAVIMMVAGICDLRSGDERWRNSRRVMVAEHALSIRRAKIGALMH